MPYAARPWDRLPSFRHKACTGANTVPNKNGLLRRIFNAFMESRQRQVDRDIARFIARSGGRLTDDMERQMMQRLLTGSRNPRQ
jgi:hypothetical protein